MQYAVAQTLDEGLNVVSESGKSASKVCAARATGFPHMRNPPSQDTADVRKWAARAWLEMESVGVPPTPCNFDLWYQHVSGTNPELSRQIAASVDQSATITVVALEELYANFLDPQVDEDEVAAKAEGIRDAAQTVVDQVAGNGEHLRQYGNTLSEWTSRLGQNQTLDSLLHAVAMLSAETARASERNRDLERQLSASTARITRLKESVQDMKREATTDILTGLFNRRAFSARLRRALSEAKAEAAPVSLLMIDVDHFKRLNDTYGHPTGDLFLRLIGRVLSDSVKGRDTASRYGGEEFAVLLVKADLRAATTVANQIRGALEDKQPGKKHSSGGAGITVSVGVAQFRPAETPASLIGRADAALYQAKELGRNRVCAAQ